MVSKIALGTVQFGLDYGISNTSGQVLQDEVRLILNYCKEVGVNYIDTARAYGESEKVLGTNDLGGLNLITKIIPGCATDAAALASVKTSLGQLDVESVYGLLYHSFSDWKNKNVSWNYLKELREEFGIKKIGFSLYSPEELTAILDAGIIPDLIQVPFNILDQRFTELLMETRNLGIEVHTRSVFLQGLFFKCPQNLPAHFDSIKPKLSRFREALNNENATIAATCLNFVASRPFIDRVVIGVLNMNQLKTNLAGLQNANQYKLTDYFGYRCENLEIINPAKWPV